MKWNRILISLIVCLTIGIPAAASAFEMPLRVVVNGERIYFPDAQPFVDDKDRTQVPIRFVSEALGAEVLWNNEDKIATIELDEKKIVLPVGKTTYELNGVQKSMDTSALIQEERTFVPLRFVSEGLGATVTWDAAIKTAYIDTTGASMPDNGSDDEVVEAEYYGFKVKHNTGSMLVVEKGAYDELGEDYALLTLTVLFAVPGADYEKQVTEIEGILLQQINPQTVDEIMDYVRKKTIRSQELAMATFFDDTYAVMVSSRENGDIGLSIHYKSEFDI